MQPTDFIPAPYVQDALRMVEALKGMDRIVVAGHVNPDGDAAGSVAAAGHILRAMGKEFMLYAAPGLPRYLGFFPMPAVVHTSLAHTPFTPQCALLLDCGEPERLGSELAALLPQLDTVNIDHHLGGDGMGSLGNWVVTEAAATAQLMAYVAMAADLPLTGDLGLSVALGLLTDTGGFCHGNTSADVLALASHLVANGCHLHWLREKMDNDWSLGRWRLWGQLMERAVVEHHGQIGFCPVSLKDLGRCQALKEDLEGFVEQLRRLRGVKVAALLREESPRLCKFSLRSYGSIDVRAMAADMGGGGHFNAAGGTLRLPLKKAGEELLRRIALRLDGRAPEIPEAPGTGEERHTPDDETAAGNNDQSQVTTS
ncbi:DHH family phosphoesterase [Desulfovibrio falkowii]|uniref:Phosphoesterase RecJ domain protein n=2 Tax=Desulfovibrio TaxID=872 RepID=B8J1Y2_DESDA|nr:DHH family phosphoesterase [uncultured Desulfovibrio sp.]